VRAIALVNMLAAREWLEANLHAMDATDDDLVDEQGAAAPAPASGAVPVRGGSDGGGSAFSAPLMTLGGRYCWTCGAGRPYRVPDRNTAIDFGRVDLCAHCWKGYHA
jgi:hypothetical protein